MKKFKLGLILFSVILLLVDCSNDENGPYLAPPTASGFKSIKDVALAGLVQKTTFKAEDGINFTSTKGVKLNIYGGCLYSNGSQVTGNVDLEFIELFDRGNMLVSNKPLMGKDNNGNLAPLVTGGEFYVNVTQGGKTIDFYCSYNMEVPANLTGGLNSGMSLWQGTINTDGDLVWEDGGGDGKEQRNTLWPNAQSNSYSILCDRFGWTNIDILSIEPGEKTPIAVEVPNGYDKTNCSVYVVYKGRPGVLAFLDMYVPDKKLFTEHYGWGPIGFSMYVVFVSESAGQYVYGIKDVTLEKGKTIVFEVSDLKTIAKDDLVSLINKLN